MSTHNIYFSFLGEIRDIIICILLFSGACFPYFTTKTCHDDFEGDSEGTLPYTFWVLIRSASPK